MGQSLTPFTGEQGLLLSLCFNEIERFVNVTELRKITTGELQSSSIEEDVRDLSGL